MTCRRAIRRPASNARESVRSVERLPDNPGTRSAPDVPVRDESPAMRAGAMFVLCQAGWFLCVAGAARHAALLGIGFAAGMAAGHLVSHAQPARAAGLVVSVMAIGWLWDSLLARTGLLVYVDSALPVVAAPVWMAALWALFAIQLDGPFRWLQGRPWLAAGLGALVAPLSFRAGAALGAVKMADVGEALLAIGLGWAFLLPACLALARRWHAPSRGEVRDS